jgi:putative protein kinase ArgK-like GTPase of G3E family
MQAAGFDYILVETIGIGQSEVEIAGLADTTVLVLVPEAGDEIQTMKAGVMEIADIFVVKKTRPARCGQVSESSAPDVGAGIQPATKGNTRFKNHRRPAGGYPRTKSGHRSR